MWLKHIERPIKEEHYVTSHVTACSTVHASVRYPAACPRLSAAGRVRVAVVYRGSGEEVSAESCRLWIVVLARCNRMHAPVLPQSPKELPFILLGRPVERALQARLK